MALSTFEQLREIALTFPEVDQKTSHGARCFFVLDKIAFTYFHENHRNDGRVSIWCPAGLEVQENRIAKAPEIFFKPATSKSGHFSGWVGMYLDVPDEDSVDWRTVQNLLEVTYHRVAPEWLVNEL